MAVKAKTPKKTPKKAEPPSTPQPRALNEQMKLFALEYLKDMNATKAAARAGYSEKTARSQGSRLLGYVVVQEYLQEQFEATRQTLKQDVDQYLTKLLWIDGYDMREIYDTDTRCFKPMDQWPKIFANELLQSMKIYEKFEKVRGEDGKMRTERVGEIVEVKLVDRLRVKEMIGRGIGAFKDRVEVDMTDPVKDMWAQIAGKSLQPKEG